MNWISAPTPIAESSNGFIDLTKSSKNEILVKMRSNQTLRVSNDNNTVVTNLSCNPDGTFRSQRQTHILSNNWNIAQNVIDCSKQDGIFISGSGNSVFGSNLYGNFGNNFFNCEEIDLTNKVQNEIIIKLRSDQVLKVANISNSNQSLTNLKNSEMTISSNTLNTLGSTGVPVLSTRPPNFPGYFVSSPDPSEYPTGSSISRNNSTFRASNCIISGCNNTIEGNGNQLSGNANLLLGSNNKVQGHYNEARGNWNEFVGGINNKAVGTGNKFTGCTFNKM